MSGYVNWLPIGDHETIDDLSEVETIEVPGGANGVFLQAFNNNVRYTLDGSTDPTSSVGFVLFADAEPFFLNLQNLAELRFIEEDSGATMQYQFLS